MIARVSLSFLSASSIFCFISLSFTAAPSKKSCESLSITMLTRPCTVSPAFAALGRSTSTVSRTMKLAVTMKMINSTSVMSTSGVTLIPTISSSPSVCAPAIFLLPALGLRRAQVRDQRVPQRIGPEGDGLQRAGQQVVANHRRDRDGQADRGRDQRFGNAAHDRLLNRRTLRTRRSQVMEGLDDAEHRAEE